MTTVVVADRVFLTLPAVVSGQLLRNETYRYEVLKKTEFPILDSADPTQALWPNLIERSGGHYVDIGGTEILAQGKAGIKAGVEPTPFTEIGLLFSDRSTSDADAVIRCTDVADHDVRDTAIDILGNQAIDSESLLGPRETANRLNATWGVDSEGRIHAVETPFTP